MCLLQYFFIHTYDIFFVTPISPLPSPTVSLLFFSNNHLLLWFFGGDFALNFTYERKEILVFLHLIYISFHVDNLGLGI